MALKVGVGTRIDSTTTLMHDGDRNIEIGDNVRLMRGTEILGPVSIADNVFINRDVYIRPGTRIGANVAIGPFVRIISDTHDIGPSTHRAGHLRYDPILIGSGTWIGASATVLAGVSIGEGSVVAAGSIVTKDVPPNTVVAGVPARVIRELPLDAPNDQALATLVTSEDAGPSAP